MGVARSITQRLIKSPVLPAAVILGGWLRLDRLFEVSWRRARRDRVRLLTPVEIHEAQRVFANTIPYEKVRVAENSPFALRLASLSGHVHLRSDRPLGVTVFFTIHFTGELAPENRDMPWLIHELTHVWQYSRWGPRYLASALQAQAKDGWDAYNIDKGLAEAWPWDQFNFEQQGDIARAYYRALIGEQDVSVFEPYVKILRSAKTAG